jgi:hypothetical protein
MINKNVIGDNNIIINENFDIIENTLNYRNKYNFEIINKNNKFPNLISKLLNGTEIKSTIIIIEGLLEIKEVILISEIILSILVLIILTQQQIRHII